MTVKEKGEKIKSGRNDTQYKNRERKYEKIKCREAEKKEGKLT